MVDKNSELNTESANTQNLDSSDVCSFIGIVPVFQAWLPFAVAWISAYL